MSDEVLCNLCGSGDYKVLFPAGVAQVNRIVVCKACTLMYANPRSQDVDVVAIEKYDADSVFEHVTKTNPQRLEKEALQTRDYADTRRMLAQRFPQRGELLEIGSGFGYLLNYFRADGWKVRGVEPNVGLCRYARGEFGLDVTATSLDKAAFPDHSFDAVLMMHVIEHVPDPMAVFREVFRILRPGGMFVLETPRYDSLMFRMLGRRERSLSCNGHIYFFTSATLAAMAKLAGFGIEKASYVGRSLTLDRLLYNVGVISKSKALQASLSKMARKLSLNRISMRLNARDMERVYLRKA